MSLPLNACYYCRLLTNGDCGRHGTGFSYKYAVPRTVVTTRKVPMTCGVCNGQRYLPEIADDPDSEYIECEPCNGKGWLWITENVTQQFDGNLDAC